MAPWAWAWSTPDSVEVPSARAAHTSARLVMLLEPGSVTVPSTGPVAGSMGSGSSTSAQVLDRGSVPAGQEAASQALDEGPLDEQDQHTLLALGGVGDLEVDRSEEQTSE